MNMKAVMVSTLLTLFITGSAYAGSGKSMCSEAESKVSVTYVGDKLVEADGTKMLYGIFEVKNSGARVLTIPLDSTDSPLMIHGRFFSLQISGSGKVWSDYNPELEEFLAPREKLSLLRGGRVLLFVFLPQRRDGTGSQQLRLRLKDDGGCEYVSPGFEIGSAPGSVSQVSGG